MEAFVVPRFVRLIFTVLVLCCLLREFAQGRTTRGSPKGRCTTNTDRCCKLGRKAARHHLISPFYTCHYEALIAGLDHQTSVANRMRLAYRGGGRQRYTKTIIRTTAFRSRLASCFLSRNRKCFESCCNAKRESMIKAAGHAKLKMLKKHVATTPSLKHVPPKTHTNYAAVKSSSSHVTAKPNGSKHVMTTPSSNHVAATPSTNHVGMNSNHIAKNITETRKI